MDSREMRDFATRVTFARAWNTNAPEGERFCDDHLALRFLSPEHQAAVTRPELRRNVEESWSPLERALIDWVAVRTRVLDNFFLRAVDSGVEQAVILGAGYDSRAYRLLLPGSRVRVYEVDRPEIQADKMAAVSRFSSGRPAHVAFVPADFNDADLSSELRKSGFRNSAPTVFLWEGVSFFLNEAAVDKVLRFMASCGAPGSLAAFDYVSAGVLDKTCRAPHADAFASYLDATDEPFCFGIDPADLGPFAAERGLGLTDNRSAPEWRAACSEHGGDRLGPPSFLHVAHARTT